MSERVQYLAKGTHDLVWIEGADGVAFTDGQLTQDVAAMLPGQVRRSLVLEPRGRLRGIVWVLRGEQQIGLLTWAGTGSAVAAELERFRFRVDAVIGLDEGRGDSVWGSSGSDSPGTWRGNRDALQATLPSGRMPAMVSLGGEDNEAVIVPAEEQVRQRVMAGEPVFGRDVDETTIPHETGLVAEAVSFTKGCYLGQELVARIESRGHVNRYLRRVGVAEAVPPSGAELVAGDAVVGTLGSVAETVGGAQALALVRREIAPGETVVVRWDEGRADGQIYEIAAQPLIPG